MKSLIVLSLALMASFSAQAECVAKVNKSLIQVYDRQHLAVNAEGYYLEYIEEFQKKGYKVCWAKSCDGLNIDMEFKAALISQWVWTFAANDIGFYNSRFVMSLNGKTYNDEFQVKMGKEPILTAKKRLEKRIPQCDK